MTKKFMAVLLIILVFFTSGCTGKSKEEAEKPSNAIQVYYLNKEETGLLPEDYLLQTVSREDQIEELLDQMTRVPDSVDMESVLPEGIKILKYTLEKKQLYIDFGGEYKGMTGSREVLARAAFVKTLCQINGVSYIGFQVAGESLTDSKGNTIGLMNANTFLDNMGSEENATKITKLDLYFANKSGDKLKKQSTVLEYSTNVAVEKVVVEQLIAGPTEDGFYPTIPSTTKIISITTKDGICYVNLDAGFTSQGYDVLGDVTIYSIVNSLTELSSIHSVQILVNGETNVSYKKTISLETVFERKLNLVEEEK